MKIITFFSFFLILFSVNTFAQEFPKTLLKGHTGDVTSVSFSPDGQMLASGSVDKTVRVWDVNTGVLLNTLIGHTDMVTSVSFSPDGQMLTSGSWDKTVILWRGVGIFLPLIGHTSVVTSVSFSPDGNTLASGSSDKTVRLWDVNTGRHLHTLKGHTHKVTSVSFSPDGNTLASGSSDKTVRVWDANTGGLLNTLTGHTRDVWSVSFSPDGNTLASGSSDTTVRVWDARSGGHLRTLTGYTWGVSSVSFSPDGQMLTSGESVKLWEVRTGELIGTLYWFFSGIAFSPDGQMLAGASLDEDETVGVWDLPDTRVSITALPVDAPAIGKKLTLNIGITEGENVNGYQAAVKFDDTALRYVESANGDYLPANAFFVPPVVEGNQVTLGATAVAREKSGSGTLATVTFEIIAIKESTLTLSQTIIVNSDGEHLPFFFRKSKNDCGGPTTQGGCKP